MTPDDKRRLAEIESDRAKYGLAKDDATTLGFLLRLIGEALEGEDSLTRGFEAVERECRGIRQKLRGTEAQRGAAMAALRELVYEVTHLSPQLDDGSHMARITEPTLAKAREALAAHSAATKPTEVQE